MLKKVFPIPTAPIWHALVEAWSQGDGYSDVECILECGELTRRGELSRSEVHLFRREAIDLGLTVVLGWDCLPTEHQFQMQRDCFEELIHADVSAVRVQDFGVFNWVSQQHDVHLILETGNHNVIAAETCLKHAPDRVKRLVLSNEVPLSVIKSWTDRLHIQSETLALGALLIFYTPRLLISAQFDAEDIRSISGVSEEDHRVFSFVENEHGTLMYLDKTLFLLDQLDKIGDSGVTHIRLNIHEIPSTLPSIDWFQGLLSEIHKDKALLWKNTFTTPLTRGFSSANKTDRQFKHLKNNCLRAHTPTAKARVLETVKKKYLVLEVRERLEVGKSYLFMTPDGLESVVELAWFQKPWGEKSSQTESHGTWLCPHVSGASSGTLILEVQPLKE